MPSTMRRVLPSMSPTVGLIWARLTRKRRMPVLYAADNVNTLLREVTTSTVEVVLDYPETARDSHLPTLTPVAVSTPFACWAARWSNPGVATCLRTEEPWTRDSRRKGGSS